MKQAIEKLTAEVETLGRVVARQNEATAVVRREWRLFADEIARRVTPGPGTKYKSTKLSGIDVAKMLTWLSTG